MMNLILAFGAGYVVANLKPQTCPACGGAMEPVSDASELPLPDRLAFEVNQAIAAGGEFLLEKAGNRAVLWFRDQAGELFEVASIEPNAVEQKAQHEAMMKQELAG